MFIVIGEANGTVMLDIGLRGGAVRDPFLVRIFTTPLSAEGKTPGHCTIHCDYLFSGEADIPQYHNACSGNHFSMHRIF